MENAIRGARACSSIGEEEEAEVASQRVLCDVLAAAHRAAAASAAAPLRYEDVLPLGAGVRALRCGPRSTVVAGGDLLPVWAYLQWRLGRGPAVAAVTGPAGDAQGLLAEDVQNFGQNYENTVTWS